MRCPRCRHENPSVAKFCSECGASLASRCTACSAELPAGAKFCVQCGAPTASSESRYPSPQSYTPKHLAERILAAGMEGERKLVTVLFADMKGSMELIAERDPEEARKLLDPVLERMMEAVHHYEGTVNQVMGDGIMALFGAPLAHEDHGVRACYAALRMQEAIRRYSEGLRRSSGVEVRIRVGLNSGEVIVRSIGNDLRMDYTAVGQTTNLASRMEQLATPGTTRLTARTLELAEGYVDVKPLGPVPVKGMSGPVEVYELAGASAVRTRLQAARARGLTRFVGRDAEMDQLRQAAEQARNGRGQVVAVVGEPGVGKSRLYYEFIHSHHAHGWLAVESGSVSYGKATAYLPLADLFRNYFKIESRDEVRSLRAKVTGNLLALDESLKDAVAPTLWLLDALPEDSPFLALDPGQRRRQTLVAAKRILLRESEAQPLLLVFEDLHWIDGETQAFLDSLVETLPSARILLAVNYRPEYQHGWAARSCYRQLRIDPLPPQSVDDLLEGLLGVDPSVAKLKPLLGERTQGNPLFLEESVRGLVESGVLAGARGSYRLVGQLDAIRVPATVQAILEARMDRLEPADKRLLQAAAVIGADVPFSLLEAIADMQGEALRGGLARLQAAELVYESKLFPELEYAFKHALTHDVAYGGVLQERKRALHARIVEVMERLYAERLQEQTELLAHHAARAQVPDKALRYLRQAGERAAGRYANFEAAHYFEQALEALKQLPATPENQASLLDIRIALGPALIATKGTTSHHVEDCYREAVALADRAQSPAKRFPAVWGLWFVRFTRGDYEEAASRAQALLRAAQDSGDSGHLLEAHHSLWASLSAMGRSLEVIAHIEEGRRLYDREKHSTQAFEYGGHDAGACSHWHLGLTHWVLGYPDKALKEAEQGVRLAKELRHPMSTVISLWFAAWVQLQRGAIDAAAAPAEESLEISRTYGIPRWGDAAILMQSRLRADERLFGELEQAIRGMSGTAWRQATNLTLLARMYADRGQPQKGREIIESIPSAHRAGFLCADIMRAEGEIILRCDPSAISAAEGCFRRALEIARSRREKSLELRAAMSLARLWQQQGRREQGYRLLDPVYRWFTEGFDTADLLAAKSLLSELGGTAPAAR
jgi:class 3 adenylate cyclase/tetratricopeptide (TPR) repeat protein